MRIPPRKRGKALTRAQLKALDSIAQEARKDLEGPYHPPRDPGKKLWRKLVNEEEATIRQVIYQRKLDRLAHRTALLAAKVKSTTSTQSSESQQ